MSLPNQVDKFNTNVDRVVQLVNGDKDTVVQTDGGPLPSIAKMLNDNQQAIDAAVQAQLALSQLLATQAGAAQIGTAGGGTVQTALDQKAGIAYVNQKVADLVASSPAALDTLAELAAALGNDPNYAATISAALGYRLRFDIANQGLTGAQQANAKANLGLGSVNNTADVDKPVSTAQAAADAQVLTSAKAYADAVGAAASSYKAGDIVQTVRADYSAPAWIPCDGAMYTPGTYPALDAILGASGMDNPYKLADPVGGGNLANSMAYSPDGNYLITGNTVTAPFIQFYKRAGDVYTKLANPATGPAGWTRQSSWTPDSLYVAFAHDSAPYVSVFKRAGDTLTKLTVNQPALAANPLGAVFSPDGVYLAIAHGSNNPYVSVYKRTGDTFALIGNFVVLGTATSYNSVAWNKDSTVLYVGTNNGSVAVYSRNGDVFSKVSDVSLGAAGSVGNALALSADGSMLAVKHGVAPYLTIFQVSGTSLTKLSAGFDTVLPAGGTSIAWSPDANYFAIGQGSTPGLMILKRNGMLFTKLPDPNVVPASVYDTGIAFSPDGQHMAVGGSTFTYGMGVYKGTQGLIVPSLALPGKAKAFIKTGK
jgi:hypothetical protein